MTRCRLAVASILTIGLVGPSAACGGDKSGGDTGYWDGAPSDGDEQWGDTGGSGGDGGAGSDADDDGLGSEQEDDFLSLSPASTQSYVFVANPDRDTVTRISVPQLGVITASVGANPTLVATTADFLRAVTFNADDDTVSVVDADTMTVSTVAVRNNLNWLEISPDGRWAVLFHKASADEDDEGSELEGGTQSFNELSVVDLDALTATVHVVGQNPRDVKFTDDGQLAIVVSDTYISVLDLSGAEPEIDAVPITDDLIDPPVAEEVVLAPDGTYAFVRQYGVPTLVLVDLATLSTQQLEVGRTPTDLDLTPDGGLAIAVARGSGELWLYDIADPTATPEVVQLPDSGTFGNVEVSPDSSQAILYSTATGESVCGLWDRSSGDVTVYGLVKPVASVEYSDDGGAAVIFHSLEDATDMDEDSPFIGKWALSVVDTNGFFTNPLRLDAEPLQYADSDDGTLGFFVMEGQPWLEIIDYASLMVDEVPLKSDPVHLGVLPGTRTAWVSQDHDLGRLSFFDADTETLQTITGFELNSGIEH